MIGGKNQNEIFTIKPDGSGVTQLTDAGNNEDPSFSPDGRYHRIYFQPSGTDRHIRYKGQRRGTEASDS